MNCPHHLKRCNVIGLGLAGCPLCGVKQTKITHCKKRSVPCTLRFLHCMALLDLNEYGWMIVDGKLEYDWESQENIKATRDRVGLLFKGCSCSSVTAC